VIRKQTFQAPLVFVLVILVIAILTGCAAKRPFWGDPKTGLILQYLMPENQVLKYQTSMESTQNFEVTIDSMSVNITSPQGELSPDMSSVIGKSFDMTLSFLGKELDVSGAEAIQYDMGPGGKRSIAPGFQALFPDLAGRPVKIEDTWTSKDTITDKSSNTEIHLIFESLNTLEGFETVNGLECVKITAVVTGILDGKGKEGGADLIFEGDIEGSDTWYFAYKKGLFVKMISEGLVKGTATVTGPQKMTIPLTQKIKIETKLIK